jgi:hypothetical protein
MELLALPSQVAENDLYLIRLSQQSIGQGSADLQSENELFAITPVHFLLVTRN